MGKSFQPIWLKGLRFIKNGQYLNYVDIVSLSHQVPSKTPEHPVNVRSVVEEAMEDALGEASTANIVWR